ncbi:MAG: radical SAM protein [Thermoanaerobaculales bacterium]|nr:radical SAM protein [Thermoanaerobaculales bacterium]
MARHEGISARKLLQDETRLVECSPHGRLRIAVGYPNSYHVAHSSLAYQWVTRLTGATHEVGVERFVADSHLAGRTLESETPLGNLDVLAFSCSFELDAVNILRILDSAGIPRLSNERAARHPLIVVGGAIASINPLPLSPAVDVFCLGAAELLLPNLLAAIQDTPEREKLLEDLAAQDGYFIPRHHLDSMGKPIGRRRRLEKRDHHMAAKGSVPFSHIVTPHTEYSERALIEMSRGCPEKCRYCWVSYNYGRLRCYPTEAILARVDELSHITNRLGFVATAVGDHPELPHILEYCRERELEVALSSLRIPAMVPEILQPLADSGARSVTIAPETGSDDLRRRLSKPIPNSRILEAVETAQRCGIENLKMYFIIGLPGESDDDIRSISTLLRESRATILGHARQRGRMGNLHAGISILVPKPYTPYHREAMLTAAEARRRIRILRQELKGMPNIKLDIPSYGQARWQGYLSRGGVQAFHAISAAASGSAPKQVMADYKQAVDAATTSQPTDDPGWSFISSAPSG